MSKAEDALLKWLLKNKSEEMKTEPSNGLQFF